MPKKTTKPDYVTREEVEEIVQKAVKAATVDIITQISEILVDMMEKIDARFNRIEATLAEHSLAIKELDVRLTRVEQKLDETIKRVDRLEFASH